MKLGPSFLILLKHELWEIPPLSMFVTNCKPIQRLFDWYIETQEHLEKEYNDKKTEYVSKIMDMGFDICNKSNLPWEPDFWVDEDWVKQNIPLKTEDMVKRFKFLKEALE